MNTRQLVYLVACVRTGSIAAAARELNVAQPSISQQLAALEHELKTRLLERDHKGVRLTAAGERFLPVARQALEQLEEARLLLRDEGVEPCGRVSIGMTQPTGNALAVPLYAEACRRYPGIELDLFTGLSSALYEQLRRGEVDLLVCSPDTSDHMGMSREHLLNEQLLLAVGTLPQGQFNHLCQQQQIRWQQLAEYPVMFTGYRDSLGYCIHGYEQQTGIRLQRAQPFGQLMTTLRYVSEGFGLLICPSTAIYPQLRSGELQALPITEPAPQRAVDLVYMHERPRSRASRLVAELVQEITRQLVTDGTWLTDKKPFAGRDRE
jgi:LysR family transcriptional regulator, nitrogen assimilation regulatory protein